MDRFSQAVDIEAAHAGALSLGQLCVVAAQPVGESQHFLVAPHPGGKADEWLAQPWARGIVPNVVVDPGNIRPVAFNRHYREAVPFDQPARYGRASGIEFVRSMGCLAQQDDPRIAKPFERVGKVRRLRARQQFGGIAQLPYGIGFGDWMTALKGHRRLTSLTRLLVRLIPIAQTGLQAIDLRQP